MLKKDKLVSCGAPGCTNRADKNSIALYCVVNLFIVGNKNSNDT